MKEEVNGNICSRKCNTFCKGDSSLSQSLFWNSSVTLSRHKGGTIYAKQVAYRKLLELTIEQATQTETIHRMHFPLQLSTAWKREQPAESDNLELLNHIWQQKAIENEQEQEGQEYLLGSNI